MKSICMHVFIYFFTIEFAVGTALRSQIRSQISGCLETAQLQLKEFTKEREIDLLP